MVVEQFVEVGHKDRWLMKGR